MAEREPAGRVYMPILQRESKTRRECHGKGTQEGENRFEKGGNRANGSRKTPHKNSGIKKAPRRDALSNGSVRTEADRPRRIPPNAIGSDPLLKHLPNHQSRGFSCNR